jgi:HK97 family phage major capsid protein
MQHSNTADAFTPEDFGGLVNLAVQAQSIAARCSTLFETDKVKVNFPLWTADPEVAFYNELDTIAVTDGETDQVEVIPSKTAGISLISNELKDDSDPSVADRIGKGLANQIARAIDAAYLADTTPKGPNGLLSLSYSTVDTGAGLANLDPFIAARFAAEAAGSELTHWIVKPETAEALSKLKTAAGSNQPLIQFVADGITIAGLPVLRSNQMDAATMFWGIPSEHVMFVQRKGTTVERFPAVHEDGTWIRAISRLGIGFVNPAGVVRGYDAA